MDVTATTCPGPLIWFTVNFHDAAHCDAEILREGMPA